VLELEAGRNGQVDPKPLSTRQACSLGRGPAPSARRIFAKREELTRRPQCSLDSQIRSGVHNDICDQRNDADVAVNDTLPNVSA